MTGKLLMIELRDKHGFTDKEVKNLVGIARNFNPRLTILG